MRKKQKPTIPKGTIFLEHNNVYFELMHDKEKCAGDYCTIHNRSDHSMRDFPQHWRSDRKIMERICPHGIGHPDPDEWNIVSGKDTGRHGCDGCCG